MKKTFNILVMLIALEVTAQPPSSQVSGLEVTNAIESTLRIYPNPAKSSLTINMNIPSVSQARISLHDMLGNELELFSENASGSFDKTFDINSLRSGIYFVRINYNSGQNTIVKKIIVQ